MFRSYRNKCRNRCLYSRFLCSGGPLFIPTQNSAWRSQPSGQLSSVPLQAGQRTFWPTTSETRRSWALTMYPSPLRWTVTLSLTKELSH
jgi:hypothetical protein